MIREDSERSVSTANSGLIRTRMNKKCGKPSRRRSRRCQMSLLSFITDRMIALSSKQCWKDTAHAASERIGRLSEWMCDVHGAIRTNVFFPAYSNRLKDIAGKSRILLVRSDYNRYRIHRMEEGMGVYPSHANSRMTCFGTTVRTVRPFRPWCGVLRSLNRTTAMKPRI